MTIYILQLDKNNIQDVNQCDGSFLVASHLVVEMENGQLTYSSVSVLPYKKEYPIEKMDADAFLNNSEKVIFLAYVNSELAGQINIIKWWNRFAYIDALAVKMEFRKQGVGRALITQSIQWAIKHEFPGLMIETQSNNVPACSLYKNCGFRLGGFDTYLYKGLTPDTKEIALFWYLLFRER